MTIVPTYTALLAILFVFLSYKVGQARKKEKVLVGTGGSSIVERAMRVQANFAEYTPITLLLLAFLEMKETNIYFIHFLCLSFSIGRAIHAYGFSQKNENLRYRMFGMIATIAVIIISSITLLIITLIK